MSSHPNRRVCIFAANDRAEKKQLERNKVPELKECKAKSYLICRKCGTMACHVCISEILNAIPMKEQSTDAWCCFVSDNLGRLKKGDVTIDVGHCCEMKGHTPIKRNYPTNDAVALKKITDTKHACPLSSHQTKKKRTRRNKIKAKEVQEKKNLVYSGYLHLLGPNILLDSPTDGDIDIHGMGTVGEKADPGFVSGIMHCVLSFATSVRLYQNGVRARPFEELKTKADVQVIKTTVPIETSYGLEREFKVEIVRVPFTHPSRQTIEALKGKNDLSDEEIQSSFVFEKGSSSQGIDITMITAFVQHDQDALVLLRFHNYYKPDEELGMKLFNLLMESDEKPTVGRSGYEVARSGGSGGLTKNPHHDKLLKFLRLHPSSTPRCTKAIKVIQKKTSYKLYYIGVTEKKRKVARCTYTPPRRGGSFLISKSQFIKWPFFADFAESKLIATLVLSFLSQCKNPLLIAPDAVAQELKHIDSASSSVNTITSSGLCLRLKTLTLYNEFNKHSIVSYNVGYHFDRFDKGMASLENKVVFKIPVRYLEPRSQEILNRETRGGGKTQGEFHFALLDWGRNRRGK